MVRGCLSVLLVLLSPSLAPACLQEVSSAEELVAAYLKSDASVDSKVRIVDTLRLLGAAGRHALLRAIEANEALRPSKEGEDRNLLLCELWSATTRVSPEPEPWLQVYPERCFGGRPASPPPGTERVTGVPGEEVKALHPGAVVEEYFQKAGTPVRHGPYTLRGPNGEALEQGAYVDGRREGTWHVWAGTQLQEVPFKEGRRGVPRVAGYARWIVLDFESARSQRSVVPSGLGTTLVELRALSPELCLLRVRTESGCARPPGAAPPPFVEYHVPRRLGRRTFDPEAEGVDFSSLKEFRQPAK